MAVIFHNADDEHAPFPHRVIFREAHTVVRNRIKIRIPRLVTIICAECDHWVNRVVDDCECSQNCHELAQMVENLDVAG